MASDQATRVRSTRRPGTAGSAPRHRVVVGACQRITEAGRSSTVTLRLAGGGHLDVDLPAIGDPELARHLTAGLRRLSWVSIDATGEATRCQVSGVSRRPRRTRLPLAAALALAGDAVPTVVRLRRP